CTGLTVVDAETGADVFLDALTPHDPAADTVAEQHDLAAHGSAIQQVEEGCDTVEFVRRHAQVVCHRLQTLVRHPAMVFLHDLQRLQANRPPIRIEGQLMIDLIPFRYRKLPGSGGGCAADNEVVCVAHG